jgi:hypothetical protein
MHDASQRSLDELALRWMSWLSSDGWRLTEVCSIIKGVFFYSSLR